MLIFQKYLPTSESSSQICVYAISLQYNPPMNVIREIERINNRELELGIYGGQKGSWHDQYRDSAWVYIGGLVPELTEGDIIALMSQWGEIEDSK